VKRRKTWEAPGWPWELEVVALLFVVVAVIVPYYLETELALEQQPEAVSIVQRVQQEKQAESGQQSWNDMKDFVWAFAIMGLYLVHLVIANTALDWNSTSFAHLFSPLLFAGLTYYRLHQLGLERVNSGYIIRESCLLDYAWLIGVLLITLLVARLRMVRYMRHLRTCKWDVSTPCVYDRTFFKMLAFFRPLVFPPRRYRACEEGILIEGWYYVMPLPFSDIHAISAIKQTSILSSGYYLATSLRSLVRIQLADQKEPVYISPANPRAILRYAQNHLGA